MGLNDLSKKEVENVFSYVLSKYDSVYDFLGKFNDLLEELYKHRNYKGKWNQEYIDELLGDYEKKTNAIKKDYRDKRIVKLTGSSVTIVGGILSFTPLAPIGWGLLGVGGGMNATTDVVDLADRSKQKEWENAKDKLQSYVVNPFKDTEFEAIYDCIIKTYSSVKDKISNDDYSIVIQGLGWNYFLFRSNGCSHEVALRKLADVCDLFKTHRYVISMDLRNGDENAKKDIQNNISASSRDLLVKAGALGLMGLAAGIGVGSLVAGMNIAGAAFRGAEVLANVFLKIGNYAMRCLNFMQKAGPVLAIVGGVASIVMDSIAIHNIDKTFEPYYQYENECKKILDEYKTGFDDVNNAICKMYEFMKEDLSQKTE